MELIKPPINFTGNKFKLLPQILDIIPKGNINFMDLFGGSFAVGLNIEAESITYNELDKELFELVKYLKTNKYDDIINKVEKLIVKYNLGKNTKDEYLKLRDDYNKIKSPILLFLLSCYSFNYQIRFNSKREFNMPCGNRGFSNSMKENLKKFCDRDINVTFSNGNYKHLGYKPYTFYYADPPYLMTIATYTENGLWNLDKELELYKYLEELNMYGANFALSNVIKYRGEDNKLLMEWVIKNNFKIHYLNHKYNNNNRWNKNNKLETQEVLITNY